MGRPGETTLSGDERAQVMCQGIQCGDLAAGSEHLDMAPGHPMELSNGGWGGM